MSDSNDKTRLIADMIKGRMKSKKEHMESNSTNLKQYYTTNSSNTPSINNDINELYNNVTDANSSWDVHLPERITSHRRVIGRFIVAGKKIFRKFMIWYVNPPFQQQREFNGSVTRSLNEIFNFIRSNKNDRETYKESLIEDSKKTKELVEEKLQMFSKREEELYSKINELTEETTKQREQIAANENEINNLNSKVHYIDTIVNSNTNRIKEEKDNIEKVFNLQVRNLEIMMDLKIKNTGLETINKVMELRSRSKEEIGVLKEAIHQIDNKTNGKTYGIESNGNGNSGSDNGSQIDYVDFENYFRGSEASIKEKMNEYSSYFNENDIVLDIGCGRGELLEVINSKGARAIGIDINDEMIDICREKQLEAYVADALSYLKNAPDNYYDGICAIQVIEHLTSQQLISLIELANRKLKTGGKLILETLNPMCLYIYAFWFYIDLTHIRPVHPYTVKYLAESKGYKSADIKFLSPVPEDERLKTVANDNGDANLVVLNDNINKLNDRIFGYQEYCIIAEK